MFQICALSWAYDCPGTSQAHTLLDCLALIEAELRGDSEGGGHDPRPGRLAGAVHSAR